MSYYSTLFYSKSGTMVRSDNIADDGYLCEYEAMFYKYNDNIIYATVSQNTHIYHQITAHARIIVYDDVAFVVDSEMYYHSDEYNTHIQIRLPDNWLEPFKPDGVRILYNRDRSHEAYILTQRIFHNIYLDLPNNIADLPTDVVDIIQNMNLANIGFEYAADPGRLEVHPFKVQAIDAFGRHAKYRVVTIYDPPDPYGLWMNLPDILYDNDENNNIGIDDEEDDSDDNDDDDNSDEDNDDDNEDEDD